MDGWITGEDVTRKESSGSGNEALDRCVTAEKVALIHASPNSSATGRRGRRDYDRAYEVSRDRNGRHERSAVQLGVKDKNGRVPT